jgi:hypothetical protein
MKQGKGIAEHFRNYGQHQIIAELDHYLPLLRYRPGALAGSIALNQARKNGNWSDILEQYWQALIDKYGRHDANKQLVDLLWWAKDYPRNAIEGILAVGMELGCYQLESIKTLMRQQTASVYSVPLDDKILGNLICYERPKGNVNNYDLLLGEKI